MAMKEILGKGEEWDPKKKAGESIQKRGNPCSRLLVVLPHMCEQHTKTGGDPGLASGPTVDARLCQVAARSEATSSVRRVDVRTDRDYSRHCAVFLGVRIDHARLRPIVTMGSQVLRLPESAGLI